MTIDERQRGGAVRRPASGWADMALRDCAGLADATQLVGLAASPEAAAVFATLAGLRYARPGRPVALHDLSEAFDAGGDEDDIRRGLRKAKTAFARTFGFDLLENVDFGGDIGWAFAPTPDLVATLEGRPLPLGASGEGSARRIATGTGIDAPVPSGRDGIVATEAAGGTTTSMPQPSAKARRDPKMRSAENAAPSGVPIIPDDVGSVRVRRMGEAPSDCVSRLIGRLARAWIRRLHANPGVTLIPTAHGHRLETSIRRRFSLPDASHD